MSHVRQQIREAAATALSGNTDAGTRVYSSLYYPSERANLPLIHVYVDNEESELAGLGGLLARTCDLVITAIEDGAEATLDNTLDTLAAQIEAQIGGNILSGLSKQTVLIGTTVLRDSDGNQPTGTISLTYQITYHTDDGDAETAL
jgi:hypothetical protein